MARIFYCPKHGRVTEEEYRAGFVGWFHVSGCEHCAAWYARARKYKAKREGES